MSYHIASISQKQALRKNRNYARSTTKVAALGPLSNVLFVALLISVLGLIYLTQITKTSSYGFEVNELKVARQDLARENRSLQVESARLQALQTIKTSSVAKGLLPIDNADHAQ